MPVSSIAESPVAHEAEIAERLRQIGSSVESGGRISSQDAAVLWEHASDEELKRLANLVRDRYHAPRCATYTVMRIINYTNVCVAQCDYCAFYVLPNQEGGYVLTREDVFAKIDELLAAGGDLVGFNGGFNPRLPLHYYADLFAAVRERSDEGRPPRAEGTRREERGGRQDVRHGGSGAGALPAAAGN